MPRKTWASNAQVTSDPLVSGLAAALQYADDWGGTLASTGKLAQVNKAYQTAFEDIVLSGNSVASALQTFDKSAQAALGA
jgi:hypothetical protein